MSRIRLLRTTSFRLATIYLALFAASALALGAFVYLSIRHEILTDFDDRIVEETDTLQSAFAQGGRERLADILEARGAGGGGFSYGLQGPDGQLLAGDLRAPAGSAGGWMEAREIESDEPPETKPEFVRALATRLSDGSTLVVGDEKRRLDDILRGVLAAFGWAVAATLALGTIGGLWLSAQFLGRIDSMRLTAQRLMAGDWSRRIPLSPVDDDLTGSRAPSTACSTASRSCSSPTGRSAPTSPTTCASRSAACCAAWRRRATATARRNRCGAQ